MHRISPAQVLTNRGVRTRIFLRWTLPVSLIITMAFVPLYYYMGAGLVAATVFLLMSLIAMIVLFTIGFVGKAPSVIILIPDALVVQARSPYEYAWNRAFDRKELTVPFAEISGIEWFPVGPHVKLARGALRQRFFIYVTPENATIISAAIGPRPT